MKHKTMAQAKIIRKDELGENVRIFDNSSPYERLKPGDVVEVEIDEQGTLRDYFVETMKWDFTHFGDTLVIYIQPVNPTPAVKAMVDINGSPYWMVPHGYYNTYKS